MCLIVGGAGGGGGGEGSHFAVFWKILPPISLYYEQPLIQNFYKATNPPPLMASLVYSSVNIFQGDTLTFSSRF